jgi:acyl carrier protein
MRKYAQFCSIDSMIREDILPKMTEVFRRVFKQPDIIIEEHHSAADFEKWDSINHMMIIARLEKEFNVRLDVAEVIQLCTVGDLFNLIEEKLMNTGKISR